LFIRGAARSGSQWRWHHTPAEASGEATTPTTISGVANGMPEETIERMSKKIYKYDLLTNVNFF